nr:unnamed protein product [Callosobruchus chinensis]
MEQDKRKAPFRKAKFRIIRNTSGKTKHRADPKGKYTPSRVPFTETISSTSTSLRELRWWVRNLKAQSPLFVEDPKIFITTDASNIGWGVQVREKTISRTWSPKKTLAYKCEGNVCRVRGYNSTGTTPKRKMWFNPIRQQNRSFLHTKPRWHKVSCPDEHLPTIMESDSEF